MGDVADMARQMMRDGPCERCKQFREAVWAWEDASSDPITSEEAMDRLVDAERRLLTLSGDRPDPEGGSDGSD